MNLLNFKLNSDMYRKMFNSEVKPRF